MTPARTHLEADYRSLTLADQERFDRVMELADDQADNGEFIALMLAAAYIAGLRIEYGDEVRKCGCSCYCGTVFNPNTAGAHVIEDGDGYNLGRHQCPGCADLHRETA
ncbi:hypothetical protein OIA45_48870 (plasmid) [Streptomyces chartreusis]|uniref:hypothetical protein n=1 Tax=Streptomyces chartreusis TaxID=1969 RepID=UPI0037DD80EE|nr:hypothetical protein OIA45_48870 [Streptomyces chartreusis]